MEETNMRSIRTLLAAALLAASLVTALTVAVQADAPLVIGYVTKSALNQGWALINKGAEDAATEANVKLIVAGPSSQGVLTGQIYAIERVITEGAKAVAIAPVDSNGISAIVRRATARGIPFVAVDTAIEDASAKSYVGTDNLAAARAQAEWLAAAIGETDKVILVNGSLSQSTGRDRRQGFLDRMQELKPKVVVLEVYTDWTSGEAQAGVARELKAHPEVVAVANAWDDGTLGAVAALRALNYQKGKVRVVGFDAAPNALALLRDGWIQADVAQMLYREGYEGVKTAIAAARGEPVPARIDTGHQVVTSENLDRFIAGNKLSDYMR
jgi:ABC-type sugar transport system substrate-binding protein